MRAREKDSRGAKRLRELFPEKGAASQLAEMFGVLPSVARRWHTGDRAPDTENRAAIQARLGIDWRWWDEPADPASGALESEKAS